jgi:hypothetical protein
VSEDEIRPQSSTVPQIDPFCSPQLTSTIEQVADQIGGTARVLSDVLHYSA